MKISVKNKIILLSLIFSISTLSQVINAGIGGNSTTNLLKRIEKDVINHHPDITILMVGTNDMLNSKKMISFQDYTDNLNEIVKRLQDNVIRLILMSPPPVDSSYLFLRHDRNLYTVTPNEKLDSLSHIIENIAIENNVLFLNLYKIFTELNLPKHNEDLFIRNPYNSGIADGVHPTSLGYHFIAENVFQFLKKNELIKEGMKIVCFGDSITRGSGSKGTETEICKNYPAFLSARIKDYLGKNKLSKVGGK